MTIELHRFRRAALLLVILSAMSGFTERPLGDDPSAGEDLAVRWCSSCHLVKPGQVQANADVPAFSAIALEPDFNADRIATFLLAPHPGMPSYSLSRIEARAIASYIESLKPSAASGLRELKPAGPK